MSSKKVNKGTACLNVNFVRLERITINKALNVHAYQSDGSKVLLGKVTNLTLNDSGDQFSPTKKSVTFDIHRRIDAPIVITYPGRKYKNTIK